MCVIFLLFSDFYMENYELICVPGYVNSPPPLYFFSVKTVQSKNLSTLYIFQKMYRIESIPSMIHESQLIWKQYCMKINKRRISLICVYNISEEFCVCVWNVQCLVGVIGDKEWFRGSAWSVLALVCAQSGQVIRHRAVHKSLLGGFDIFFLALNFSVNSRLYLLKNLRVLPSLKPTTSG